MPTIRVDPRFNGPPDVVNGGYACATLAAALGGVAEVTLRRPVPVATDLALARETERVTLTSPEGELLAVATPGNLDDDTPEPVSVAAAEAAMRGAPSRAPGASQEFPCFVCSPQRSDGFQMTPGPVPGRQVAAAVWRPQAEFADPAGRVADAYVWAVLDCTGSIAAGILHAVPGMVVLLGRMTAALDAPVHAGETLVAMGWSGPADGRKLPAGAALFREDGTRVARARLVCFAP